MLFLLLCPLISNSRDFQESAQDSARKRVPRIGVFLPLGGGADVKSRTETALEFYKGMVLANEMRTALDSGLEFHVFDHRNSAAELRKIVRDGCLDGLDFLVGPMRQALLPLMDSISEAKKIPMMNVLSQGNLLKPSDGFHSQQSGLEAMAENGFSLMKELAIGKKAGIVYGTEKNDSILAEAYRKICRSNGMELVLFRKVGKNSAANLSKYLSEAGLDSVSHLFVANNENLVRVQLLSAYGILQSKFPVLIHGKWLESPNADLDEYASLPFYFINSDLPFQDHATQRSLESNFISRWGNPPGWISWKGFDLVLMLSGLWNNNRESSGFAFDSPIPSTIFGQYLFEKGRGENLYCPIYKVEQNGITRVRP